jgi:hypothetical protein
LIDSAGGYNPRHGLLDCRCNRRNAGQWLAGLIREGCLQSLREGSTDLPFPGVPFWRKAAFSATQQLG